MRLILILVIVMKTFIKTTFLIFSCFLLTSTGHLAWMYHLMEQTSAETAYQISTVAGYAAQALGMAALAFLLKNNRVLPRMLFVISVAAYVVCLFPAVLGTSLAGSAVFGLLLSVFCGAIAGYYLFELTKNISHNRCALSFGIGYGAAALASWPLSLIENSSLITCALLAVAAVAVAFIKSEELQPEEQQQSVKLSPLLLLLGGVVLLFSFVNNIGFSYSADEVQNGLRPEFSRVFYAVGLIAAGFVTDFSRKYGAVCALAALVIPFVVLALRGEPVSSAVFWALGYFAFGFYAVFRVILFSDISRERHLLFLSGFGLALGRLGDALGAELYVVLKDNALLLVILAAILFVGAVFAFIKLFQQMYLPAPETPKSEGEIFELFADKFALSAREREVLRLLIDNKTNKEIAALLCVSENTVKFHVRNLLQKTDCKSRVELRTIYHAQLQTL